LAIPGLLFLDKKELIAKSLYGLLVSKRKANLLVKRKILQKTISKTVYEI